MKPNVVDIVQEKSQNARGVQIKKDSFSNKTMREISRGRIWEWGEQPKW